MNLRLVKPTAANLDQSWAEQRSELIDDGRMVCVGLIVGLYTVDELPPTRGEMFPLGVHGAIFEAFRELGAVKDMSAVGRECIRRGYSDGPATIADLWPIPGLDPIPSPAEAVAACVRIRQSWQARTLTRGLREAAELAAVGALPIDAIAERVRQVFKEARS
jgi:hypothetical protein